MPPPHSPRQNRLLAALPPDDYLRLQPHLELVPVPLGHVLHECGCRTSHIYFPTTAIVSLLSVTRSGSSAEIALVGNEGAVDVSVFMGSAPPPSGAVVQNAGYAYMLTRQVLHQEFALAGALHRLLLRYTQALLAHVAQTAVCNRHHSLDQQLCRCLLQRLDRLPSNELTMTQEMIANVLGVRREGVTEAAGRLQSSDLIHYSRGKITVVNRSGLEARVCECYQVIKNEFDRLLSGAPPRVPDIPPAHMVLPHALARSGVQRTGDRT